MGKVTAKTNVGNVESLSDLKRFTSYALTDIASQINGAITLSDNLSYSLVGATFAVANTEVRVAHYLGRTPVFFVPSYLTAASTIYLSATPDAQFLYLKASSVCGCKILAL